MSFDVPNAKGIRETDKALLVEVSKRNGFTVKFWVPKSVITDESEVYDGRTTGKLVVHDWFAEKEKLADKID